MKKDEFLASVSTGQLEPIMVGIPDNEYTNYDEKIMMILPILNGFSLDQAETVLNSVKRILHENIPIVLQY